MKKQYKIKSGIMMVPALRINPEELSLTQKIAAILGISETIDFCFKHKIYFHKSSLNQSIMYICPICFKNIKEMNENEKHP